jgi:hypothetical protein
MKMKSILKYISLLTVVLLLSTTSCEDFLDVNVDPNNPTEVTPDLVLPVAMKYSAELMQRDRNISHLGAMMMQMWSQSDGFSWYTDEFKYNVTSNFYDHLFANSYTASLKQYQILDQLTDPLDANYRAIAKVMKAYHFQLLVDLYGDVPYSEALLRKDNATPVYDNAQDIYADLISQLDTAISLITNADELANVPGDDDCIFGGDMGEWIKFANTVKLRILVREDGSRDVQADMDAIIAEGSGFITSDVLINPGYAVDNGRQNPLWNDLGWDVGGTQTLSSKATCATQWALDLLTGLSDPRIDYIYEEPASGHLGVVQGLLDYDTPVVDAYIPELVSNIGPGILKSASMGANIFTLAEAHLLQAQAALAGLTADDARMHYEAGVQASFDYLGAGDATTYLANATALADWDASSGDELEAIITQKWIAVNGITAEQAWFDYNKTGFPTGCPLSLQASTPDRPVRLMYTADELSANGDNVPTQPNAFTAKIFWAGN